MLALALAGCGKTLIKPEPVIVTQRVPVAVPAELTKVEPLPKLEGDTVGDYLRNRAQLLFLVELYMRRMELIRNLPEGGQ